MGGGWGQGAGEEKKGIAKMEKNIHIENIKEHVYYKITPISFYTKSSKHVNSDSQEIGT